MLEMVITKYYLPGNVDRGSAELISLGDKSKDLTLTELRRALLEKCSNLSDCTRIDSGEKTITVEEGTLAEWDSSFDKFLLGCCHFVL